jgi:hypothetical protein
LPTPGPTPVDHPTLPVGPQQLLTISLKIAGDASGTIPLHVLNAWQDATHPPATAFLSVGDTLSVDQTCVPVTGAKPCEGEGRVSQVVVTDGSVTVATATPVADTPTPQPTFASTATPTTTPTATATPSPTDTPTATPSVTVPPTPRPCVGDCNGSRDVTVDEVITLVNIALENLTVSHCEAGDANHDGHVTVDEILLAVSNSLNGCP